MKQAGFTLIEVMISLVIGVFLLAGVMFTYLSIRTTTTDTLEIGELQENARLAMDIITRDLSHAGFWGTYSSHNLKLATPMANPGNDCTAGVNNGSFPEVSVSNFKFIYAEEVVANQAVGCINNALDGSDVIQIKRASGENETGNPTEANQYYVTTEMLAAEMTAGGGVIAPANINATVWPYNHHVYYVANQTLTLNGQNRTIPSLMRRRLTVSGGMVAETVLEGVENIRFLFGLDTNGDARVDMYKTSTQMTATDWEQSTVKITTVQVFILVRSLIEDGNAVAQAQTFTLGGVIDGHKRELTFNDRFRRLLLVSTVSLHNASGELWQ